MLQYEEFGNVRTITLEKTIPQANRNFDTVNMTRLLLLLLLVMVTEGSCNSNTSAPPSTLPSASAAGSPSPPSRSFTNAQFMEVMVDIKKRSSQLSLLQGLLRNYDVNEWPHYLYGKRTDVHVQMFINSFGSLNAASMDFRLDLFLRQRWQDPRLAYSGGRDHITVMDPEMQSKIWCPDTYFNNVKEANIHQVTLPNVMLRIGKWGDVLYSMRFTLILSCYMDFEDYPFDTQVCDVNLAAFASTVDMITYHWEVKDPIVMPDDLEIAEFDLLENKTGSTTHTFSIGNFSGLVARFIVRRQNGYHILQTYIPTILIVSISWVSFWLDPNAVPGRVTLGVTTLLTLTTLASGVRQSLPPVSYVKAIDVWVGMCMIMVFGALLEFTVANWLANKKIAKRGKLTSLASKLPECGPAVLGGLRVPPARPPPRTHIGYARALDRASRVMFPAMFLLFNIFYWPYYILIQYGEPSRKGFEMNEDIFI